MSDYSYWRDRLAGRNVAPTLDAPQCGFYRDRQDRPVAFYLSDRLGSGVPSTVAPLVCVHVTIDGHRVLDEVEARALWNWCCVHPVTEEAWRAVAAGGAWPDSVPGIGHNQPLDSPAMERLKLVDTAESWVQATPSVNSKGVADQAAKLITELRRCYKDLEVEEEAAKRPYLDFIATVRERYKALREPIGAIGQKVKAVLQPWITAEAKRVEDARLAAIEENKAKQERGERASAPPRATAGRTGSKVGLKRTYSAEIVDFERAYRNAGDEYEMKEALQVVANRLARGVKEGMTPDEHARTLLPGTKLVVDEKIV